MSLKTITTIAGNTHCIPLSLEPDESLLREASLRSSGATVHAVRGLVGAYMLAHAAGMRREFEAAERRLRQFVVTGAIEKS